MENNPKKKMERIANPDRQDKTGTESRKARKTGKGTDKTGDTASSRLSKALEPYDKALAKKPDDAGAWAGKASVFLKHRMYGDFLKAIEKALELEPENATYLYEKGFTLLQLNRDEAALQAFDRSLEIKPDSYKTWNIKTSVLCRLMQHEKTIKTSEKSSLLQI